MPLKQLTVRGFKSIRALEDFELGGLNVLIGANGAGKSNFLSLFRMMAALVDGRLQLYVQEQDGPDPLLFGGRKRTKQINAEFFLADCGYRASLKPSGKRLLFVREEVFATTAIREGIARPRGSGYEETRMPDLHDHTFDRYVRPAVGGWRVYHFHDTSTSATVRQEQPVRDNLRLKTDGSNLAPFLRFLRERHSRPYDRIVEAVRMVAPFFRDFVHRSDPGERVELEWSHAGDPDTVYGPRQLSDGTLRFICLATLLLQPAELQADTILVDEPELGLHPYALSILAALFRQASDERQLIISTQSADLVSEFDPKDIVVAERKDGASTFQRLEAERLREWLEDYSLGELWKTNVIGGGLPA